MSSILFSKIKFRDIELKNRIMVSPMCQYSAVDGVPGPWHMVHLGSRAIGGAALVVCEATGVSAEGRISLGDTGIWNDRQMSAFAEIAKFIKTQNSVPGIQLAHAGRKASTQVPWEGDRALTANEGAWTALAPSALAFGKLSTPKEMNHFDLQMVLTQFVQATRNAERAGFQVLEIHMAHGYLLNEFLSPLANHRQDEYGGSIENRMRYPLQVAVAIREAWPEEFPLFVRISASDWMEGGWTLEDSVVLAGKLKQIGVDLIDCSSGGISPDAKIKAGPGYQVPFAEGVRKGSDMRTGAVGIITEPQQAEEILQKGQADLIIMAREFLRDPYWPLHAAKVLGEDVAWPKQYARAKR